MSTPITNLTSLQISSLVATDINSDKKGLFGIARMTTVQRNRLTADGAASNGLMIYNTDTDAFDGYSNGVWRKIGGGGGNSVSYTPSLIPAAAHRIATYTDATGSSISVSSIASIVQANPALSDPVAAAAADQVAQIGDLGSIQFKNSSNNVGGIYLDTLTAVVFHDNDDNTCSVFGDGLPKDSSSKSAILEINTDKGALLLSRLTNDEITNSIAQPRRGMILFNQDTSAFAGNINDVNWASFLTSVPPISLPTELPTESNLVLSIDPDTGVCAWVHNGTGGSGVTSVGATLNGNLITSRPNNTPITSIGTIGLSPNLINMQSINLNDPLNVSAYIQLKAQTGVVNYTLALPPTMGTPNYILSTDGGTTTSGTAKLSWVQQATGGGTVQEIKTMGNILGGPITTSGTISLADNVVISQTFTVGSDLQPSLGPVFSVQANNSGIETVAMIDGTGNMTTQSLIVNAVARINSTGPLVNIGNPNTQLENQNYFQVNIANTGMTGGISGGDIFHIDSFGNIVINYAQNQISQGSNVTIMSSTGVDYTGNLVVQGNGLPNSGNITCNILTANSVVGVGQDITVNSITSNNSSIVVNKPMAFTSGGDSVTFLPQSGQGNNTYYWP